MLLKRKGLRQRKKQEIIFYTLTKIIFDIFCLNFILYFQQKVYKVTKSTEPETKNVENEMSACLTY